MSLCASKFSASYLPVTKITCKHGSFLNMAEYNTTSFEQNPSSEFNSSSGNQEFRVASDMLNTVSRRACLAIYIFYISFYCATSLITDYKYTYVTINGL